MRHFINERIESNEQYGNFNQMKMKRIPKQNFFNELNENKIGYEAPN